MKNVTNRKRPVPFVCNKSENRNGKLPYVCCKWKWKIEVCFLWSATTNGNQRLLFQQTCPSMPNSNISVLGSDKS